MSPKQLVSTATAVSLEDDGDYARFENRGKEDLDFMLIEAEPTRESIASRVSRNCLMHMHISSQRVFIVENAAAITALDVFPLSLLVCF